jgi:hypothetical protein
MSDSATLSGSGAERRAGDRTEILGGLHGEVMVYQAMTVKDLSHGGAQVETAVPLQIDSLHDLRLELSDAAVVVKGRVVYCRIANIDPATITYRSGLEFIQPSSGIRSVISHFLDTIRGEHSTH